MSSFIAHPPAHDAACRLFCFPHSGGGSARYFTWAKLLSARFQALPIQLPGREMRYQEEPYTRLDRLVDDLFPVVRQYLDKPYVLFGYSLGAFIGFELAREIRRRGLPQPDAFFVCAAPSPEKEPGRPFLHQMSDADLLHRIRTRYGGIPEPILREKELLDIYLRIIRADFEMVETYAYEAQRPFDFPIQVFGGERDTMVGEEDLAGWRAHTSSGFSIELMPGDHFFINENQDALLQKVEAILSDPPV